MFNPEDHVLYDTPYTLMSVVGVAANRRMESLVFASELFLLPAYQPVFEKCRHLNIKVFEAGPPDFVRRLVT